MRDYGCGITEGCVMKCGAGMLCLQSMIAALLHEWRRCENWNLYALGVKNKVALQFQA